MIDIHTHILPLVDDGSGSLTDSLKMLKNSVNQGVTDVFLTPHLRRNYALDEKSTKKAFVEFSSVVKSQGINVNLYLGQEIYISPDNPHLQSVQQIITLNDSKYVLIEFDFSEPTDIVETVYEASRIGYKPIVCHFERYLYSTLEMAEQIKENGGYIQVNAHSVTGENKSTKKFTKKLLKERLVDFVASDLHSARTSSLKEARELVEKKYGKDYANELFYVNAKKIIDKD